MKKKTGGLYIHIPFCRNKCIYCDFYTGGVRIADWKSYNSALLNELEIRKKDLSFIPDTLYIGGGTPSLLPPEEFSFLINGLKKSLNISEFSEFTIEVNPEDVNEDIAGTWLENGVNRISIGIQSFNDNELESIGRRHTSQTAKDTVKLLSSHFKSISIDVMFGIPGQTIHSYKETLECIVSLNPTHISSYSLMLEEGTAMTNLVSNKKIILPSEEEWMQMFLLTSDFLQKNGYKRYEISNFSKPGYESKHNRSYWNGTPYLGLGPGAHSYDGINIRRANKNDLKGYVKFFSVALPNLGNQNLPPFYLEEKLNQDELREEMIMTGLRTSDGIELNEYELRFGSEQKNRLLEKACDYINQGFLKESENHLSLTDKGILISNKIMSDLF